MNSNKKRSVVEYVNGFCRRFSGSIDEMWDAIVPQEWLMKELQEEITPWRERIYGPLQTLKMFIEQVLQEDHGCRSAVAQGLSERIAVGALSCSANTGAYCKARMRLPLRLPVLLAREIGSRLCAKQPEEWRWRKREVKLIDGTTVSMPDTEANQKYFPQNKEQKEGLGFPLARVLGIVSLSCCAVLGWALGPCEGKGTGETALLWKVAGLLEEGDVVIADRCYTSYFMISLLGILGVDIVFRQHQGRKTDFEQGKRLGKHDHIVVWKRPKRPLWMDEKTYFFMPETLQLREVRVGNWTLVSTLTDAKEVSKIELSTLYRLRWQIELDLRSIKSVMQMDILRCKSPMMILKEIAVHLLAYNLIRATIAQAAYWRQQLPRQISFKGSMQIFNEFRKLFWHPLLQKTGDWYPKMLDAIAQQKLPYRPGRVEPRLVKRRPKPRGLLMKPRHVMQKQLLELQQKFMVSMTA